MINYAQSRGGFLICKDRTIILLSKKGNICKFEKEIENILDNKYVKYRLYYNFYGSYTIYNLKEEIYFKQSQNMSDNIICILNELIVKETLDIKIRNYFKEKIEYVSFDYSLNDSDFLLDYKIESIRIIHDEKTIKIEFNKVDAIPGVGISYMKYTDVNDNFDNTEFGLNDIYIEYPYVGDILKIISDSNKLETFAITIKNNIYDMRNEVGIITYFNISTKYHNFYLNKILVKSKHTNIFGDIY